MNRLLSPRSSLFSIQLDRAQLPSLCFGRQSTFRSTTRDLLALDWHSFGPLFINVPPRGLYMRRTAVARTRDLNRRARELKQRDNEISLPRVTCTASDAVTNNRRANNFHCMQESDRLLVEFNAIVTFIAAIAIVLSNFCFSPYALLE